MSDTNTTHAVHVVHARRRTLPSAIGEPMVWLTGGALVVCLSMIVMLVLLVVVNGSKTFWPRAIDQVTMSDGEMFLGIATEHERVVETGAMRTLYRVGNRDIGQESFRWIDDEQIASIETPDDAVMLEREAWGVWFGVPESIVRVHEGEEDTVLAHGSGDVLEAYEALHHDARKTKAKIEQLKKEQLGSINAEIDALRLNIRQAEIESARDDGGLIRLGWVLWFVFAGLLLGCVGVVYRCREMGTELGASNARQGELIRTSGVIAAVMLVLAMWIAGPWKGQVADEAQLETMRADAAISEAALLIEYDEVMHRSARSKILIMSFGW